MDEDGREAARAETQGAGTSQTTETPAGPTHLLHTAAQKQGGTTSCHDGTPADATHSRTSLPPRWWHSISTAQDAAYMPMAMNYNSSSRRWRRIVSPQHGNSCRKRNTTVCCTTVWHSVGRCICRTGAISAC